MLGLDASISRVASDGGDVFMNMDSIAMMKKMENNLRIWRVFRRV